MPDIDHEAYVLSRFESLAHGVGAHLGSPVRHDASRDRLRVDFVYPEAKPKPVAVELTRLTNEEWRRGGAAVVELARELHLVAEREERGHWTLHVAHPIDVRDHRDQLHEALRRETEIRGLTSGPIVSFSRHDSLSHQVDYMISGSTTLSAGDAGEVIADALAANLEKLQEAHEMNFETHLVIWAEVGRFFGLMNLVEVPPRPVDVDVVDGIWVISNVDPNQSHESHPLAWFARPGDTEWVALDVA
ncbi:MAG TPA: hypothetical protein VJ948_05005 [Acidimicrobiia bacterium]|nr:hypothetical protein [Acidimicrobiia bacterium]